jgi:hypothetical protein
MVSLSREFSIANQQQGSYTLLLRRTVAPAPRDHGVAHSRKARRQRDLRRTADVPNAAHLTASTSFRPVSGRAVRRVSGDHIGRGWMTTGSTKPDAMPLSACAFVIAARPVSRLGFTLGASPGASTLKPMAAHGARHRSPVRRVRSVGARRPGVSLNGYQKNAGGWHPPGRNADRRHQR